MADDVLVNKAAAIERAVRRVRDEHAGDDSNLLTNQTKQDAIILNLQRACESSIDHGQTVNQLENVPARLKTACAFPSVVHVIAGCGIGPTVK